MDWQDCDLVEVVPGKVSGAPILVGTRIPVEAIISNYDSFLEEGMSMDGAIDATAACYPSAGMHRIRAILQFRTQHEHQLQP